MHNFSCDQHDSHVIVVFCYLETLTSDEILMIILNLNLSVYFKNDFLAIFRSIVFLWVKVKYCVDWDSM